MTPTIRACKGNEVGGRNANTQGFRNGVSERERAVSLGEDVEVVFEFCGTGRTLRRLATGPIDEVLCCGGRSRRGLEGRAMVYLCRVWAHALPRRPWPK